MVPLRCIKAMALETTYTLLPFVVGAGSWTDLREKWVDAYSCSVFSALRIYAVCDKNIILATLVAALSMVVFAINVVRFSHSRSARIYDVRCSSSTRSAAVRRSVAAVLALWRISRVAFRWIIVLQMSI